MKWWRWAGQVLLLVLLVWFVGGTLAAQWSSFRSAGLQVTIAPGWVVLAGGLAIATFGLLIQSWRLTLAGWGQRLGGRDLAEIWFLANLGRYLPGKVWSIAGMIVLATRKGVPAWAASAAAVVVQALGLATAIGVAGMTLPASGTGWRVAAVAIIAATLLLAFTSPAVIAAVSRRIPRIDGLRPLPLPALVGAGAFSVAGWLGYGASLWALARGLGSPDGLSWAVATGGFALAYTVGLLAVFAPGGIVVREGILVALLAPLLGAGPALALTLGSRVVLTAAELLAATPFVYSWLRSAPRATG